MKKFWHKIRTPLLIFLFWRVFLFVIAFLGTKIIPYFGNSFPYADTVLIPTKLPAWIWGFGNFDGVHYLRIAQNGYVDAYYQAFFPLFPLLIHLLNIFPKNLLLNKNIFVDPSYFYTGLILSNLLLLFSLVFLEKTCSKKDFLWTVLLLLSFPTAFYFGAIYTESLFLFLLLMFIFFLKKDNYLASGITSAFASGTKIFGVLFLPIMVIKYFIDNRKEKKNINYKTILGFIIAPTGLLIYLIYLWRNYKNPFIFLFSQPGFGAERNALPVITLPQVFYRYFKMLITVKNPFQFFTVFNELAFTLTILILIIWVYRKIDFYSWILSLLIFLMPTLTGTLSSMPRYILFSYILLIPVINTRFRKYRRRLMNIMVVLQILFIMMYIRGYWVA